MYDPHAVLDAIDAHKLWIFLCLGGALACNVVWYVEAVRISRRDHAYPIPLACVYFWLAHDATFVAAYSKWFTTYDHWFTHLLWAGLTFTTVLEVFFLFLVIRYGRQELFPDASPMAFAALIVAGQVAAALVWLFLKDVLADELFQISIGLTVVWYPMFGMVLLSRRGSRRGQSLKMWLSYLLGATGFFCASLAYGPFFTSARWLVLGGVSVAWVIATCYMVYAARPSACNEENEKAPGAALSPSLSAGAGGPGS